MFKPEGLRVLVADDDTLCLKVVAAMLSKCNYEGETLGVLAQRGGASGPNEPALPLHPAVTTATTAAAAMALLRRKQPCEFDLVLSDVHFAPGGGAARVAARRRVPEGAIGA
jgi:CheY-like chemotaxis protein